VIKTNNLKITAITPIIAPADLRQVFPLSEKDRTFVSRSREQLKNIIQRKDRRLMVVVGPCSIHDTEAAVEYAKRLSALSRRVEDQLLLIMRVYFEKPRTTVGWKGLINDPDMNGTHLISKGLGIARGLLSRITALEIPVANEMLFVLQDAGIRFALVEDQEQVDKLLELKDQLPRLEHIVYDDARGMRHYNQPFIHDIEELMAMGRIHNQNHPGFLDGEVAKGAADDIGVMLYTSGTTGKPKGVCLTHHAFIRAPSSTA